MQHTVTKILILITPLVLLGVPLVAQENEQSDSEKPLAIHFGPGPGGGHGKDKQELPPGEDGSDDEDEVSMRDQGF